MHRTHRQPIISATSFLSFSRLRPEGGGFSAGAGVRALSWVVGRGWGGAASEVEMLCMVPLRSAASAHSRAVLRWCHLNGTARPSRGESNPGLEEGGPARTKAHQRD